MAAETPGTPGHPPIARLPIEVVNRIAAGEIIQRPYSALKELLENALDAGATSITVTCKDGGRKVLQIQDNGHGIRESDFALLCERHATSKLRQFDDLETIETLGFRGEALASISFVAHLTVTSQTADAPYALQATYHDGKLDASGLKPCASTQGTTVLVEDLFYNVPLRQRALRSASEEFSQVLDVVGRYAMYCPAVGFTCRRQGESRADLVTPAGATRQQNIQAVHGPSVARALKELELEVGDVDSGGGAAGGFACRVRGLVTGSAWSGRKSVFVLFINGRPVDCGPLRRACEATVSAVLQKPTKPFIFLDVRLPSRHVDVNVHPTKKEVAFLYQEELIEALQGQLELVLRDADRARVFSQTQLPSAPLVDLPAPSQAVPASQGYRPDKLVRTDARALTLDAYLVTNSQQGGDGVAEAALACPEEGDEAVVCDDERMPAAVANHDASQRIAEATRALSDDGRGPQLADDTIARSSTPIHAQTPSSLIGARRPKPRTSAPAGEPGAFALMPTALEIGALSSVTETPTPGPASQQRVLQRRPSGGRHASGRRSETSSSLASIELLLADAAAASHAGLAELMKTFAFVGMASWQHALVQQGTRLFLLRLAPLLEELAYQRALTGFGEFTRVAVEPPVALSELFAIAHARRTGVKDAPDARQGAEALRARALSQAAMLEDHFCIDVDRDGRLASLPALFGPVAPAAAGLPDFAWALQTAVDWTQELACFRSLARALGRLFGRHCLPAGGLPGPEQRWTLEHQLLPLLRSGFDPDRRHLRNGNVVELTRLEQLYRVFERC